MGLKALELFAGAGGMALGVQAAGFEHAAVIESEPNAVQTLKSNAEAGTGIRVEEPIEVSDARSVDYSQYSDHVDIIAAGAPCQPFSLAGNHNGRLDKRDLFPEVLRAQKEIGPKCVLIENVRGLARPIFRPYLEYILLRLALPGLPRHFGEKWTSHSTRLKRERLARVTGDLPGYNVWVALVECANLGAPQKRSRLFIVALRADFGGSWEWPKSSHTATNLLHAKYVDGSYWANHAIDPPKDKEGSGLNGKAVGRDVGRERWMTVRDALADLPDPRNGNAGKAHPNHIAIPGARVYPSHSGSFWDEPSKTIKAGAHGVPGGENMLRIEDGSVRYFTVHEAALLQTFPSSYIFSGTRTAAMRQIGNAAPPKVVEAVARRVREFLLSAARSTGDDVRHITLVDGGSAIQI